MSKLTRTVNILLSTGRDDMNGSGCIPGYIISYPLWLDLAGILLDDEGAEGALARR
jgi:hypothetical protein